MTRSLTFDAVCEASPGPKWQARWRRAWPDYRRWFRARGGDGGPSRAECEAALARHMPELVPVYRRLVELAGGGDRAARFLSTWCPPPYLGGCSLAAVSAGGATRLVRNYDLSPDLNEGLLLHSAWTGAPVMAMVEFLWGVSDGINAAGLSVALAFGGRGEVAEGFGITTILRHVLETCASTTEALAVLGRVPSHMAYNVLLADRHGVLASVEMIPGGGMRLMDRPIATNHQHGPERPDRPGFTRTVERRAHLEMLLAQGIAPEDLASAFLDIPLYQRNHAGGFGTLFTAEYDPGVGAMTLHWPGRRWHQRLDAFEEGRRRIAYGEGAPAVAKGDLAELLASLRPHLAPGAAVAFDRWIDEAEGGTPDWTRFGNFFAPAPPDPGATHR